jgi:hypothetical protein
LFGATLYFGALWLFYRLSARIIRRLRNDPGDPPGDKRNRLADWLPYGWYLAAVLAAPLSNGICRGRLPDIGEHAFSVIAVLLCYRLAETLSGRIAAARH